MRLGLIGRADNSGLGIQAWEAFRHLQPVKTLVIDVGHLANDTTHCNKRTFRERFPGARFFCGWTPDRQVITEFLDGLDVVLTFETPYSPQLLPLARERGVKVIIQPNYEFLDRTLAPDLWAAPSSWCLDRIPDPKTLLPVPIATDRFPERPTPSTACNFLHIVGRPAVRDRNGTEDLLAALKHVQSPVTVTFRCQDRTYLPAVLERFPIPEHVTTIIDNGDTDDYWDNYRTGDVMVMPRRFGGLCLPVNEALGAGIPCVLPAISPNTSWLPSEWLVPASKTGRVMARNWIDVHTTNARALASKIDQFATDAAFYATGVDTARRMAKKLSWDALRPEYVRTFEQLL